MRPGTCFSREVLLPRRRPGRARWRVQAFCPRQNLAPGRIQSARAEIRTGPRAVSGGPGRTSPGRSPSWPSKASLPCHCNGFVPGCRCARALAFPAKFSYPGAGRARSGSITLPFPDYCRTMDRRAVFWILPFQDSAGKKDSVLLSAPPHDTTTPKMPIATGQLKNCP